MDIKTLRNKLVVAVAVGAILSASAPSFPGTIAYSAVPEAAARGMDTRAMHSPNRVEPTR